MDEQEMNKLVGQIIGILKPLSPEERKRVVSAAFILLGDQQPKAPPTGSDGETAELELPNKAQRWAKQYGITQENLADHFHIDGQATEVITVELPGKNDKEKTQSAYILTGLAALLSSDNPHFEDKTARGLCERHGCYNSKHHTEYIDAVKNLFVGSKKTGWTLTTVALKQGATLIKPSANE